MKKLFLFAVAACAMTACGPQKDNNPITNTAETLKDVKLAGKTFSACGVSGIGAIAMQALPSKRTSYKFEGANVTRRSEYYSSTDCTGNAAYTMNEIGQMDIQTDKQTKDGARFIDLNFNKLNVEVNSDEGAAVANRISMCGANDWKTGDKREVTAHSAEATCLNAKLTKELQVYRVEGDILTFGSLSVMNLAKEGGRPTSLDKDGMRFAAGK